MSTESLGTRAVVSRAAINFLSRENSSKRFTPLREQITPYEPRVPVRVNSDRALAAVSCRTARRRARAPRVSQSGAVFQKKARSHELVHPRTGVMEVRGIAC